MTIFRHLDSSSALANSCVKIRRQSGCKIPQPLSRVPANMACTLSSCAVRLLGESSDLRKYINPTLRLLYLTYIMMMLKSWARFSTQISHNQNNMKRFYKEATYTLNQNSKHPLHKYLITLDGKTIKTPYRNVLAVPNPVLAFLVTNQFNRQLKHMKTGEMPILALCRTAVDADIEGHLAEHLRHSIYEYLKTDTLLFHDDTYVDEHGRLIMPLINNFTDKFEMNIKTSSTFEPPVCEINPNFENWLHSLNNWQLIGMQTMTIWMKSTIAAYSVIGSSTSPQQIQTATYLEQITQMKSSGQVQQKIMDVNQIRLMVSCGQILYRYGRSDDVQ